MFKLKVRYQELKLYGKEIVEDAKWDAVRVADEVVADVGRYPPVPPSPPNRYKRTNNLARSWSVSWPRRRGHIISVDINNSASYASLVVGDEQWELHARHGWRNINDVKQRYDQDLADRVYRTFGKHHWDI